MPNPDIRASRVLSSLLTSLIVAYGAVVAFAYFYQERLVYFPLADLAATPRERGLEYEEVWLTAEDGVRLHGWFIPANAPRAVLLYFHGNAGNISHRLERIALFHRLRLSVFIVDYRGYGKSEGAPSEQGTYRDAAAAWRYLTQVRHHAPDEIVVFGRSLGGGVAAQLAAHQTPRALIVESAFTSMTDLGGEAYPWLPVRWLSRYEYPVQAHLARVQSPVLIVHSRQDEIIPFRHGEKLYAHARAPKRFLEIRGGHNDSFLTSGETYTEGLDAFLSEHLR
jgi:fermentation-respiration switch protein FrsA (DUF1100 family)